MPSRPQNSRSAARLDFSQTVVVHFERLDVATLGEDPRLRGDRLGHQHRPDGAEAAVKRQSFDVTSQLFDPVDLTPSLHFDRHQGAVDVGAHEVDRAQIGRILPPEQDQAFFQHPGLVGQQFLEVGLDPVLLKAGIGSQSDLVVGDDLLQVDDQALALANWPPPSDSPVSRRVLGAFIQLSGL